MPAPTPFIVRDALVMPLQGTLDHFAGGVFQDGACLRESLLFRGDDTEPYGMPAASEHAREALGEGSPSLPDRLADRLPDRLEGEYLFGGYLFRHYGHFLIETLSRLYALKHCPPVPIIFSSTHREIMPWQFDVFKLLGLRNQIIKMTRPTVVERLVMAAPGFVLPDHVLPEQLEALGAMPAPPLTERKIWLARSSHIGGGLVNERDLLPHIEALGFEIVHPQYLPIRKQVALIASSARVAGLDGSAFHTALLAKEIRGRFDIFFLRNTEAQAYTRIAGGKGFTQRETPLAGSVRFLLGEGAERFYELHDMSRILDVLRQD